MHAIGNEIPSLLLLNIWQRRDLPTFFIYYCAEISVNYGYFAILLYPFWVIMLRFVSMLAKFHLFVSFLVIVLFFLHWCWDFVYFCPRETLMSVKKLKYADIKFLIFLTKHYVHWIFWINRVWAQNIKKLKLAELILFSGVALWLVLFKFYFH